MHFEHSRFYSSAAALILLASTSAIAQWWNPMYVRDTTNPNPKIVYTHAHVEAAKMAANGAVFNDDFPKLERMYAEFMDGQPRATDGTFMVEALQSYFGESFLNWDEGTRKRVLANWEKRVPDSKLRQTLRPLMHQALAWRARGAGGASTVPGESIQIFREELELASRSLKETESVGKESPLWWWAALIVAGSTGMPPEQFDRLFEEAIQRFPLYKPFYYTRVNYLLPQWGGSFEAVDRFIEASVARTASVEGEAMYAWLYLDISGKTRGGIEATRATWPRMKRAFEDMVARYPDDWNRNLYATSACRARDKATTARLLTELGDKAALGIGAWGITTESCRRFVAAG
jgi:hypothetical protein